MKISEYSSLHPPTNHCSQYSHNHIKQAISSEIQQFRSQKQQCKSNQTSCPETLGDLRWMVGEEGSDSEIESDRAVTGGFGSNSSGRSSTISTSHNTQSVCLLGISCVIEFLHGGSPPLALK